MRRIWEFWYKQMQSIFSIYDPFAKLMPTLRKTISKPDTSIRRQSEKCRGCVGRHQEISSLRHSMGSTPRPKGLHTEPRSVLDLVGADMPNFGVIRVGAEL